MLSDADVRARLEDQSLEATQVLREVLAAHPGADHVVIDYLFGLDHAVLVRARAADHHDLAPGRTLFPGFANDLVELDAQDRREGTDLASALRGNETVRDLVDDWIDGCWRTAGGPDLPMPTYLLYEGDSDWFEMRSEEWGPAGAGDSLEQ